jgi:hypothetical protein
MPYADPEVRRAYSRAANLRRYAANRDEIRAKARAKYHADPSRQRKASDKWIASNLDKVRLKQAESRARRRGLEFNLTAEDIVIPDTCPVLGIPMVRQVGRPGVFTNSPTLDRIDNSRGYVKGNVWIISGRANSMKNCADPETLRAFARWIRRAYGE